MASVYNLVGINLLILLFLHELQSVSEDAIKIAFSDKSHEQFPDLLSLIGYHKRVHILSEISRNGRQLHVEEYLDLESWSQLIQFKWLSSNGDSMKTKRLYALIINDGQNKYVTQYRPYECFTRIYDSSRPESSTQDWRKDSAASLLPDQNDQSVSNSVRHNQTIQSILSTARNSPYLSRIPTSASTEAHVFGVAGAWIKARYHEPSIEDPTQPHHIDSRVSRDSQHWALHLVDAAVNVKYYFETPSFGVRNSSLLSLMELKHASTNEDIDLVNVIDIEFDFSDQLALDLFQLPIGFNCPANPVLSREKLIPYHPISYNIHLDLEIVVNKYKGLEKGLHSRTEIKTISLATSNHPMSPDNILMMLHDNEDRFKVVHDYYNRLKHTIHYKGKTRRCDIDRLDVIDAKKQEASDPIGIYFDNGLSLVLDSHKIRYLLGAIEEDRSNWRPLNIIQRTSAYNELVYEAEVSDSIQNLIHILDKNIRYIPAKLSVVRVFKQEMLPPNKNYGQTKRQRGLTTLSRVILIAKDPDRNEKVAEIRLNILKQIQPLSFQRRAQIFDLRPCYEVDKESVELVATYPVDGDLLEHILARGFELTEKFYTSSLDWLTTQANNDSRVSLKTRLGASMNFLRVPKVELTASDEGELELRVLLLGRLSLVHLFDHMPGLTVSDAATSEVFIVKQASECAELCEDLNCSMFSIDCFMLECKLSHNQLIQMPVTSSDARDPSMTRKISNTLYYRTTDHGSNYPWEASLKDLQSYLGHNMDELDIAATDGVDDDSDINRPKRDIRDSSRPLLGLQFTTRSNLKDEYSSPIYRSLIPSKVAAARVPLTFDVSMRLPQMKVYTAFNSRIEAKRYSLTAIDPEDPPTLPMKSAERTFIDTKRNVYYTLKKIDHVRMEECSTLCYNIREWDSNTDSQQICESFSFCRYEHECVLMIRTDRSFTKSILDVASEGDIILEVDGSDKLIVNYGQGCSIAKRGHLSDFEGPIVFEDYSRVTKKFTVGIEYEWLRVLAVDSSKPNEFDSERCSNECAGQKHGYCLGFDYCSGEKLDGTTTSYQTTCYIMLVANDYKKVAKYSTELRKLRNQMAQASYGESTNDIATELKKDLVPPKATCHRFLLSILREYTHTKDRKFNNSIVSQFWSTPVVLDDLNLDGCALECLVRDTGCLAFQYCITIDEDSKSLNRDCTVLGGLKKASSLAKREETKYQYATTHVEGCHIYIKTEYSTLDDLLRSAKIQDVSVREHLSLIVLFWIIYGLAAIGLISYVVMRTDLLSRFIRRRNIY